MDDRYDDPLNVLCHKIRTNLLLIKYQRVFTHRAAQVEESLYKEIDEALSDYVRDLEMEG
jgi:hypothetical protein